VIRLAFDELNEKIRNCRKCPLWKSARQAVPGEGPENAAAMVIGQNPGEEEDISGRPFVGRSGKLLNEVLKENGINRQKLFVTNIVKHKTPDNRKPHTNEIQACLPHLLTQITKITPRLVILMGEVAWRTPREDHIIYFETYHPSAAMRFPRAREKFKKDFEKIEALLHGLG